MKQREISLELQRMKKERADEMRRHKADADWETEALAELGESILRERAKVVHDSRFGRASDAKDYGDSAIRRVRSPRWTRRKMLAMPGLSDPQRPVDDSYTLYHASFSLQGLRTR